jgi:hypothetical protein
VRSLFPAIYGARFGLALKSAKTGVVRFTGVVHGFGRLAFRALDTAWAVDNGEILMTQTLEIREKVAAPAEYRQIRDFFDQLAGAESAPIVFVKQ